MIQLAEYGKRPDGPDGRLCAGRPFRFHRRPHARAGAGVPSRRRKRRGTSRPQGEQCARCARPAPFSPDTSFRFCAANRRWTTSAKLYRRKLIACGLRDELIHQFIAFKFFLILFFPIVGGLLKGLDMLDLPGTTFWVPVWSGPG